MPRCTQFGGEDDRSHHRRVPGRRSRGAFDAVGILARGDFTIAAEESWRQPSPRADHGRHPAIRNLIREDKSRRCIVDQTGSQYGMQTLDQCLQDLVKRSLITRQRRRLRKNKEIFK